MKAASLVDSLIARLGTFMSEETKINHDLSDFSTLPILVTGGAGFIGSHTVIELVEAGFSNIVIVDNFVNSSMESVGRVKQLTSHHSPQPSIVHYDVDLAKNMQELQRIVVKHRPFACIHFAGLKAVGESIQKPLLYYQNNLISTTNLLEALAAVDCNRVIFSSSATVYGNNPNNKVPVTEACEVGVGVTNPYGKTKYFIEEILKDYAHTCASAKIVLLRYFNPIGAHKSGLIGEDPQGVPSNLMPFLSRVAIAQTKKESDAAFYEKYKQLNVFGDDYDTPDGTGVRDYIHVVDLGKGHVNALVYNIVKRTQTETAAADKNAEGSISVYNLGTGKGTSVLQLKDALQKACGFKIPFVLKKRRPGDIAELYADCSLAEKQIQWKAEKTIDDAVEDSWNWQSKNPYGFKKQ